ASLASQFDAASGAFAPLIQEQREKATAERNAAREFEARLAAAEARLGQDERVIEQLQSDLRETREQREVAIAERNAAREFETTLVAAEARIGQDEQVIEQLQSDVRETRSVLELVLGSRSWRLTAPLRQGSRFLSRLRETWLPPTAPAGSFASRLSFS